MPDLPQNVTYKSLRGAIAPMIKTAQDIGRTLPQPSRKSKRVDVSGYRNLMNQMGNYRTAQSTPAMIGGATETTPYGGRTAYESYHPGVDYVIPGDIGAPVKSFIPGTVEKVKTGQVKGSPGFGNYVVIRDQQGNLHRFSHLLNSWVEVGEQVQRGTPLGQQGNTGQTYSIFGGSGAHVDYRVKDIWNRYISPYQFINA